MNKLAEIQQIVNNLPGHEIIFTDPVKVKSSPHTEVFTCWGIHAERDVWLMDGAGQWHGPLEETQINAGLIIQTLYQRLEGMKLKENEAA